MGAPSSRSATVSRRSAWLPRVSSSRSSSICAAMAPRVVSMNSLMDREHTLSISCRAAGSELNSKAISIKRRHATPSPTRYASKEYESTPRRTSSRATAMGSEVTLAGTGAPGSCTLAAPQNSRFDRLLRPMAAASSGSDAMAGLAPSTAWSSSSSHSGRALTTTCAHCRISSRTCGDGGGSATGPDYRGRCKMHR